MNIMKKLKWNYYPKYHHFNKIFIEELSIGNLMSINEKIYYCFVKGKLIRKIYDFCSVPRKNR